MNTEKGNDMKPVNEKSYLTLQEAVQSPDFENVRRPVKPHPRPCTNEDCFWHGRLDMANVPSLAEERWQIVDEGDRWAVWFVPCNHPERWKELASFSARSEAMEFLQIM